MANFRILKHPNNKMIAIKEGWCWPAFLFGIFWAIYKKLWSVVGIMCVVIIIAIAIEVNAREEIALLMNFMGFVVGVVCGVNGNSWLMADLRKRGYDIVDTIEATTDEGAIALIMKRQAQPI